LVVLILKNQKNLKMRLGCIIFHRQLVQCMQRTLFQLMPAFLSESDEDLPGGNDVVDLKKQNRNSGNPTMCKRVFDNHYV